MANAVVRDAFFRVRSHMLPLDTVAAAATDDDDDATSKYIEITDLSWTLVTFVDLLWSAANILSSNFVRFPG